MFILERCNEHSITRFVPIYPNDGFEDFEEYDAAAFLSTLFVEATIGSRVWQIGDSGSHVEITMTESRGSEGMEEFIEAAKTFYEIVEEEIPQMSDKYKLLYQHYLKDFTENGLDMPVVGKVF